MSETRNVFIQVIEKPARKVIIKRGIKADEYWSYCEEVGCDVWGLLTSIKSISGEPVCLWLPKHLRKPVTNEYVQGVEVEPDYSGVVPEGFETIDLPASTYLLFRGEVGVISEDFVLRISGDSVWNVVNDLVVLSVDGFNRIVIEWDGIRCDDRDLVGIEVFIEDDVAGHGNNHGGGDMLVYYSLGNFVNWTSGTGAGTCDRMVGGMAQVTLTKDISGEVRIVDSGVKALVCHVTHGHDGVAVYPLSDYTDELADLNAIREQDSSFTRQQCVDICNLRSREIIPRLRYKSFTVTTANP